MTTSNDQARTVVLFGLGKIPEVGGIISGLLGALWPSSEVDVWAEIKDRVAEMISQKLSELQYKLVKENLSGLKTLLVSYRDAVEDRRANRSISELYTSTISHFEANKAHFMSEGQEVPLLPLLAPMANMHLALLRDGVTCGTSWGWDDKDIAREATKLRNQIKEYSDFVAKWYKTGLSRIQVQDTTYRIESWRERNKFVRFMTLSVLDFAYFWPYYDPAVNPGDPSAVPALTRTIYSDPIGTADGYGITIRPPSAEPITAMNAWGWTFVDAFQVTYGGVWGARLGSQPTKSDQHGVNTPPQGWSVGVQAANPMTKVSGHSGHIPEVVRAWFKDGKVTSACGGFKRRYPPQDGWEFGFDGHVLSSVDVMGASRHYGSANCVVFGFRFPESYPAGSVTVTGAPVAIISAAFPNVALRMDGSGVTDNVAGHVNCQYGTVGAAEWFRLHRQPDGAVVIEAKASPGAFLRMDARAKKISCQRGNGELEKFLMRVQPDGTVAFESAASPGHYLSVEGTGVTGILGPGGGTVRVVDHLDAWEKFRITGAPVSIASAGFAQVVLRMDGTGVDQFSAGGVVNCQFGNPGERESFRVLRQADGSAVIELNAMPNVFLQMDVKAKKISCRWGADHLTKFQLREQADGTVAFESLASPGHYLSLNGSGLNRSIEAGGGSVGISEHIAAWEKFRLVA
jgi:hypothetical protein